MWSHYLFGLEGNKDPDIPDRERNTRYLTMLKDRDHGNIIRFPMYYDKQTSQLLEPQVINGSY